MDRRMTRDALGAWLVRCNPDIWDIVQFMEDGNDWVDEWTVQDNYRSDLMRIGDPIVLWVAAGPRRRATPGVWGVGHVVGRARGEAFIPEDPEGVEASANDPLVAPGLVVGTPADEEPPDIGYWLDALAASRAKYGVPVDIPLLLEPLAKAAIAADPGLSRIEVLRQPQMGNPSWLNKEQWALLLALLPEGSWEPMNSNDIERLRTLDSEAAPDPVTRDALDTLSMAAVMLDLRDNGWWFSEAAPKDDQPWDLTAERDGVVRHLRIVGTTLHEPHVSLLPWEHAAARDVAYWELAVVTRCLAQPTVQYFTGPTVLASAEPSLFRLET